MELENRIHELKDLFNRKMGFEKRLEEINNEIFYLRDRKHELAQRLEKDDVNIKDIETKSIIYLWYEIFTSKGKTVSKIMHDYKLTFDIYDLVYAEAIELKNKIDRVNDYKDEYNRLLAEKETLVLEKDKQKEEAQQKYEEEIIKYKSHLRDINESIQSAKSLQSNISYFLDLINKAKNWATIDIFGRGLFGTITKTDTFKQSAEKVRTMPYLAGKLIRDIRIIHFYMNIDLDILEIKKFSDYMFNDLYNDITNKERMIEGLGKLTEINSVILNGLRTLTAKKEELLREVSVIEIEKQKFII